MHSIRESLKQKIYTIITNDLTIGKNDNGLKPFNLEEITIFILNNGENIEKTINIMITDYANDGDLELLKNPENDWITEYLYEYIKYF